jgi:hypothetical protein
MRLFELLKIGRLSLALSRPRELSRQMGWFSISPRCVNKFEAPKEVVWLAFLPAILAATPE